MAIVKETVKVFFQGISTTLEKGVEYSNSAALVVAKPELFEVTVKKAPKAKKVKVEEVKIEETFEEPKEELLIEEPVAELEVTEIEEVVEEKPKSRRKRK